MKLLILLVALLVRTNPSLSKPTPNLHSIFKEIKQDLGGLQKEIDKLNQQEFKKHLSKFNHTVKIQTPHDLKNACECEAPFVQHLKDALMLVEDALIKEHIDEIANILENLEVLPTVKEPNDNCHFKPHKLTTASVRNDLIKDNVEFIQNWNTNCNSKHHKRN
ncbi:hypothetical protein F2P79_004913 [Pimephales promelas]|nr:hypothetical protein F2P79_004913 [Pimephales promelas]